MNKGTLATNVAKVEAKEKELAEAKAKAKVISHACSLATPPAVPWFHRAAHTESVCARLANLVCACVRDGGGYGGGRGGRWVAVGRSVGVGHGTEGKGKGRGWLRRWWDAWDDAAQRTRLISNPSHVAYRGEGKPGEGKRRSATPPL